MSEHLLDVRDLCISFVGRDGNALEAVNKLNLHIDAGEIVGVVGESGCGKSVFAQSVMRLLEHEQKMAYTGQILFDGEDLLARPLKRMREVRGCDIAMIFQDPLSSLNPVMTVGAQVVEAVRAHRKVSRREARNEALSLLERVGIRDAVARFDMYPGDFSGGMRQRVMIAMALAGHPRLLIADEPTTALDTTTQKQILDLLRDLNSSEGMAVLFISSLLYLRYWDQDVLRVGIFYGSNWEVPGTVHYEILDKAIKKFKSKYPNIKVEYEKGILSDDYSEWLSEQILKGEEPDVYLVLDEDFHTLASLGALKNLDGVINVDKEFKKEEFYSSVYKAGQYGGSQYALPMECNPTLMFVNKTLLQKEGIKVPDNDWTWDDFYRICEKMAKDSDGDGQIEQFGYYDYTWLQAVYSNGISPFNKKGTSSNFLDERFSQSLEFVKRLEETNRNYQVTSNDFDLGKVAFRPFTFSDYRTYMPYPWRIKKYSSFEWTCIRMPAGPSGDNRSEMSALMAGMSSRTGKKQAAWDFIKMLTTDEDIQRLIYEDTSAASVLKSVNTSKSTMNLLNKDTPGDSIIDMSLLDTVIDTGVIPYRFKDYTEAYEKTDNLIKGYVNEKDDSSTFLFQMKNQIDEILKK